VLAHQVGATTAMRMCRVGGGSGYGRQATVAASQIIPLLLFQALSTDALAVSALAATAVHGGYRVFGRSLGCCGHCSAGADLGLLVLEARLGRMHVVGVRFRKAADVFATLVV